MLDSKSDKVIIQVVIRAFLVANGNMGMPTFAPDFVD